MITVEVVVAHLSSLPYAVKVLENDVPDLTSTTIYVSYATIAPQHVPNPLDSMLYNQHGEDLFQTFDIHIVSTISNFSAIWSDIYKLTFGWNPTTGEINDSGFVKGEGGKIGMSNGYMHWIDRWMISFPTLNVAL